MALSRLLSKLRKREKPVEAKAPEPVTQFNAVIEGAFRDSLAVLTYKIAHVPVHHKASSLYDGSYKYLLVGTTTDFQGITCPSNTDRQETGLETRITESLGLCKGVVFNKGIGLHMLERPRALVTRDGRVFIEEGMLADEDYLDEAIPDLLSSAKSIFAYQHISELYITAMRYLAQ